MVINTINNRTKYLLYNYMFKFRVQFICPYRESKRTHTDILGNTFWHKYTIHKLII